MPVSIRPQFHTEVPRLPRRPNPINRFDIRLLPGTTNVDGVLEGGAALGVAYVGSLRALEQSRIWFSRIAGNSAGAITAALIAAGYRASEIDWLCAAHPGAPARPRGVPAALEPIDFLDFLDFPSLSTIGTLARRKTLLWKVVKGQVIDELLKKSLPVPTRRHAQNEIVNGLKRLPVIGGLINGVEDQVRDVLRTALIFLPAEQPKLEDFKLFDTEALRIAFADAIWSAVASVNPALVMSTQLNHEGSIFEGKVFLDAMKNLLRAKMNNNPNADVLFKQLELPLAVIATNIRTRRMVVYSSRTHPNMEVAEAVRRSMSLPVIFEPRGNLAVDGGLCSNLPAWLYTTAGDAYWPPESIDTARAKVAFSVDETARPPSAWRVGPGKFRLNGDPETESIDLKDVVTPIIVAKLRDQGLWTPSVTLPEVELAAELDDWKLLQVIAGSVGINQEEAVRRMMLQAMFANRRFFNVSIPLRGFHGFDFAINGEKGDYEEISERGWLAARDALAANPTSGAALIANPGSLQNPY